MGQCFSCYHPASYDEECKKCGNLLLTYGHFTNGNVKCVECNNVWNTTRSPNLNPGSISKFTPR